MKKIKRCKTEKNILVDTRQFVSISTGSVNLLLRILLLSCSDGDVVKLPFYKGEGIYLNELVSSEYIAYKQNKIIFEGKEFELKVR